MGIMIPQIRAKFRKRNGVPYAVERLTGVQYRCRICNEVFINEEKFDRHLREEITGSSKIGVSKKCPNMHDTITSVVYYAEDVLNALKTANVKKFKSGDTNDSMFARKKRKRSV